MNLVQTINEWFPCEQTCICDNTGLIHRSRPGSIRGAADEFILPNARHRATLEDERGLNGAT